VETSGEGGSGVGVGYIAGLGGALGAASADAIGVTSASANVTETGGLGGEAGDGATAGAGGSPDIVNAVSGVTNAGTLSLTETANGGSGGDAQGAGGQAGAGGNATADLTFDDLTANPTQSDSLTGTIAAYGGYGANGFYGAAAGAGGDATANTTLTGTGTVDAYATAAGSNGGKIIDGTGNGSAAGNATASASATSTTGAALADAQASGGVGGQGDGAGSSSAAGGTGDVTSVVANGYTSATAIAKQYGNDGGGDNVALAGVTGGTGGKSVLDSVVSGETSDGLLELEETAGGGYGASNLAGVPGAGGYAEADEVFDDTKNATQSNRIVVMDTATAGGGGSGAGGNTGGEGGNASGYAEITGSNTASINVQQVVTAGSGASATNADGGAGGNVFDAQGEATGGSPIVNVTAMAGNGGTGNGSGFVGGAAGEVFLGNSDNYVIGAAAYGVASAEATYDAIGGVGGYAASNANAAAGGESYLQDEVTGSTSSGTGTLALSQVAQGGSGGASNDNTGAGGAGGAGTSILDFSDLTNAEQSEDLQVTVEGNGGSGGAGETGGVGGAGAAESTVTGSQTDVFGAQANNGTVDLTLNAVGAFGGTGANGSGGNGGAVTQASGEVTGERVNVQVQAQSGTGGSGSGTGNMGGNGGALSDVSATGIGTSSVVVNLVEYGGSGGGGLNGASGGAGAESILDNAVGGSSSASDATLSLTQTANGGRGGASAGGTAGAGGNATSDFTVADTNTFSNTTDSGTANALAGSGGAGTNGSAGAAGGAANASDTLTGPGSVDNIATANAGGGGAGASGAASGAGGSAVANDIATGAGTITAVAGATGGSAGGTGAAGGTANSTATANGLGASSTASATAVATGGSASGGAAQASATATSDIVLTAGNLYGVSASASGTNVPGTLRMISTASIGGSAPVLDGANDYAFINGLPGGNFVSNILTQNAAINNVLGSVDSTATILGYGTQGGVAESGATGSQTVSTSEAFTLNAASLSGNIILGLVSNQVVGSGFTALNFTVDVGTTAVLNDNFATVAQAQAFFSDQALNLGAMSAQPPGNVQVTVDLTVTSATSGSGFGASFLLGTTGVNGAPAFTVPGAQTLTQNVAKAITGVSLSETGNTTGEQFDVTVQDTNGALSASGSGGATVTNVSATELTINGTLAQVNAALGTLKDTDGVLPSDTITFNATDSLGGVAAQESVAVTVPGTLVINVPSPATATAAEIGSTVSGISLSEPGAPANASFSVTLSDNTGQLSASNTGGATVTDISPTDLSISGTLIQVNAALATLSDTAVSTGADTITLKASDGYGDAAPQKTIAVTTYDSPAAIEALTATQIEALHASGVTQFITSGAVSLSVAQAQLFEALGMQINPEASHFVTLSIQDSGAQIETLTAAQISALPNLSTDRFEGYDGIVATSGSVTLSIAQALALAPVTSVEASSGTVSLQDTPADITALTAAQVQTLNQAGYSSIAATGSVTLDATEAEAIEGTNPGNDPPFTTGLRIVPPSGDTVTLTDSASDIELMSATQLQGLPYIGVSAVNATGGSLALTVAQAEAVVPYLYISVPTNDTATISDSAANIKDLLDSGTYWVSAIGQFDGISSLVANDGSIALSAQEAENLEQANANSGQTITVGAPAGDSVTLSDTAGDIETMTAAQLGGLTAIGVTAITVTDQSLTLSVPQALALYDPVPVSVPAGDQVIVTGSVSDIEGLTEPELVGLAAIGVTTIDVSGLQGLGPLTIDGGLTLAIDGAVPPNQIINFAGSGGTLSLDDTPDMAGTVYGFSPPDTIDLTDVAYDNSGNGSAVLGTDPNDDQQAIDVTENGNSYFLDIDPSQVFLTPTTFELSPDSLGTGTDVTVIEDPVDGENLFVQYGQTADGLVLQDGGTVQADDGATANRTIIDTGGTLIGSSGSTINDTFINSGGLLDLAQDNSATGTITFGPAVMGVGGGLEIDDTSVFSATIAGFAAGDNINLTSLGFDPNGTANLATGNMLNIVEDGTTYMLQLDPSQDFSGEYFHLAPDAFDSGTGVTESDQPCYCRGTLILTEKGEVPVEELEIGDFVVTVSGACRAIKWIGKRGYSGRFVWGRKDILPICIKAGALDGNVPLRDLWISPHHAMYIDGILIEARDLVNGISIYQCAHVDSVEYFHIELDSHDVILAEGAWSETFLDDDNRTMFHNVNEYKKLHPDQSAVSKGRYYAPRLSDGYEVEHVRQKFASPFNLESSRIIAAQ
jgi:hypothetical protein